MKKWVLIGTITAAVAILAYMVVCMVIFRNEPSGALCTGLDIQVLDSLERQYVTPRSVESQLRKCGQDPVGLQFSQVSPQLMEDALLKDPMVKTADCSKLISGLVRIKVTQRKPVLRVAGKQNYYVDEERQKLPTSRADASYVPIITGCPTEQFVRGALFDFVEYLERDSFWNEQVEQINITQDKKIQLVPHKGDHIIQLGSLENYPSKLEKMKALYTRGFQHLGCPAYSIIDLEYKDQIVCRKREN